jgi:hypothetical protein
MSVTVGWVRQNPPLFLRLITFNLIITLKDASPYVYPTPALLASGLIGITASICS